MRRVAGILALLLACVASWLFVVGVGEDGIGFLNDEFFHDLRMDRAATAAIVGAALALSGMLLQAILRNPLASPFVLGVTSGAGLGIVVAAYIGYRATGELSPGNPSIAGIFVGSFGALGLVLMLSRRRGVLDPPTLLLVGVMISILFGAMASLVQSMLKDGGFELQGRWMLGNIDGGEDWIVRWGVGGVVGISLIVVIILGTTLDAATLGDDEARSIGADLGLLRIVVFLIAGVLTSLAVWLAGPIGFIGLVCPHAARWLVGPKHRVLSIATVLAGAALLMFAEGIEDVVKTDSGRLPVGVMTALIGGPVFVIMLRRGAGVGGGST
ncbi:MAG: iron ABC transporter permease [Planctomycetota bacterium]